MPPQQSCELSPKRVTEELNAIGSDITVVKEIVRFSQTFAITTSV
jgi:hypothetical protein